MITDPSKKNTQQPENKVEIKKTPESLENVIKNAELTTGKSLSELENQNKIYENTINPATRYGQETKGKLENLLSRAKDLYNNFMNKIRPLKKKIEASPKEISLEEKKDNLTNELDSPILYESLNQDLTKEEIIRLCNETYEIIQGVREELGEGGTAKVYRAKGGKHCLKEITSNPEELKEIEEVGGNSIKIELNIQNNVSELGIRVPKPFLTVSDPKTNRHFIMMETILGSTLEEALNNPSLFPSNFDPIRYKQQFNEAVRIMHENGIYHRDLFTKNLMIDQNGDFVLIDFGMSIDTKKTPTRPVHF